MSRYRPPRPPSSPYITPDGHRRLSDELKHLWKVKRPEVTAKVAAAAALGDRSENADYIYGKRALREIDARIQYLSKRLDKLTVVDKPPRDTSRVYFGARVTVLDDDDEEYRYRLVGPDEFDQAADFISVDSPLARALLKKTVDEEITIETPSGEQNYFIKKIEYPATDF